MSAGAYAHTPAGVLAEDEERWFDEASAAFAEQDEHARTANFGQSKAIREDAERLAHEAKRAVIDRFYAMGWERA